MKFKIGFSPIIFRYILLGFGFGVLLPVLGTSFQIIHDGLPFNSTSIIQVQQNQQLLWIIDTAPFFLGFLFGLIGVRQDLLIRLKNNLQQTVEQRTSELQVVNDQLIQELDLLHQAEGIARRAKQEWEITFDAVADLIFVTDLDGNIIRCNEATIQTLNSTFGSLIGRQLNTVLGKNNQSLPMDLQGAELEIPRLGGYFEVFSKQITIDGMVRKVYVLQSLFINSPVAIIVLDEEERIASCNPAFESLFGFVQDETIGANLDTLISTENTIKEASDYTQQVLTGGTVHGIGKRKRKDGLLVDVEILGVPVIVAEKRVGALAIYHDPGDVS
jgi:PAS domain S-box-containing protein